MVSERKCEQQLLCFHLGKQDERISYHSMRGTGTGAKE